MTTVKNASDDNPKDPGNSLCFGEKPQLTLQEIEMLNYELTTAESMGLLAVVFDMGHVTVHFDWEEVVAGFAERACCTPENVQHAFNNLLPLRYEAGECDTETFVSKLNEELELTETNPISISEFEVLWNYSFEVCPLMDKATAHIRAQGRYKMFIMSTRNVVHGAKLEKEGAYANFPPENWIFSDAVGSMKPEPGIYECFFAILKALGISHEQAVMFDDRPDCLLPMRKRGCHTVNVEIDVKNREVTAKRWLSKLEKLGMIPEGITEVWLKEIEQERRPSQQR